MKKRVLWIVLVILLTAGVTFGEYSYLLSQVENDPLTEIYVINKDLKKGDPIQKGDLITKAIRVKELEEGYIQDPNKIIGKYAAIPMHKGNIVLSSAIEVSSDLLLTTSEDKMLITFEFNGETSNAWNIRLGQKVELLFCTEIEEKKDVLYKEVIVAGVYDNQLLSVDTETVNEKRFVTFEINKKEGYELISNRYNGRVEIIIL
jgi:hypothetical protein